MPSQTNKGRLENSLLLTALDEGQWHATASSYYAANNGLYGGWTAAIALNAVVNEPRSSGTPAALTINYFRRIKPESEIHLHTKQQAIGQSFNHWQVEIFDAHTKKLCGSATVVMANRKPGPGFQVRSMPQVEAPEGLSGRFKPPGAFGDQTDMIAISGYPPIQQPNTHSLAWVKEKSGRAMDAVQLAYLADAYPPRIWYTLDTPCAIATVTLSVYFYATEKELDAIEDNYVLLEAEGIKGESSNASQRANIWSDDGKLLASTEQLVWFDAETKISF